MAGLSNLDFLLIFLYFIVLLLVGYFTSRKQKDEDYLIGERKLGALSTMATLNASKTGSIVMIIVALTYVWGIAALWYFIGMTIGILIFLPFALRLKDNSKQRFYTLADYFKYNYGKRPAIFASLITIFLMFGYLVLNLMAGTKIFSFFTGWPFWLCAITMVLIVMVYILMGGFKAVVRTDIVQYIAIIFILGALAFTLFNGSLIPASEWNFFKADTTTIAGFFVVGILMSFAMPDVWRRVYAAKNKKALKKGMLASVVVYALVGFLLSLVALTVKVNFPEIDPDLALIYGFGHLLPKGLLGLSVVFLFAAIMSSIDTYFFTGSSAIVQDFFNFDKKKTVKSIKKTIFILAILGTLISILIQSLIISTYIFVVFVLVLGTVVISTWIRKRIKPLTLTFGFAVGIISIIFLLVYYMAFAGGVIPEIAVMGILLTILGLLVGGGVSYFKYRKKQPILAE